MTALCSGVGRASRAAPSPRPAAPVPAQRRQEASASASFIGRGSESAALSAGASQGRPPRPEHGRIGQYPAARQIALARRGFAPDRDAAAARARSRRQQVQIAQPLPSLRGVELVQPRILERQAILGHPVLAPQRAQALGQPGGNLIQVFTSSAAYSSCAAVSGRFDQSVRVWPLARGTFNKVLTRSA